MAVGADHFALSHLVKDALPWPPGKAGSNVEPLVAQVVELEHDGVPLTAVPAGVSAEVLDQEPGALEHQAGLAGCRLVDVALSVGLVVLTLVLGAALPTEAVALVSGLPVPSEVLGRLQRATPGALEWGSSA